MWKLVLNDYRYNLKLGFQRAWNKGDFFLYLYMMIIPAVITDYRGCYYCCILPVVVGVLISRMFAGYKNKTLFLCPLSEEQRKEYFRIGYIFRVGIGILIFLVLAGSQVILRQIKMELFLLMLVTMISFLTAVNIWCPPVKDSRKALEREWKLPGHYEFWNIIVQLSGNITMLTLVAAVTDEDGIILSWEWGMIVTMVVFHCIIAWKMVRKYYKPLMEQYVSYEVKHENSN